MRFVLLLRDHLLWALPWVCDFFAWGSAEKPDLRDAVCRGNASEVRELLDSGLDASLSNGYPWSCDDLREPYHTSVHHAAQEGLIDILRLLLAAWPGGAQARDGWGNTPGHYAASAGQMEALELLLSWWPEGLRTTDTAGLTLLHWAAAAGQLRVLEMLMQRWPEGIYVIDSLGRSLLHWAASKEHLDVLDLVLPRWPEGARVISNDGWTPLQQASCAGILHRGCNLTNSLPLLRDAAINLECGTSHELSKLELKLWLNCGGDPWYEGASGTPLSERLDALDAREFLRAKKAEEGYYSRLLSDYRTYVVPTAAIAVAWAAVLFEEHFDRVFFLCKTYSLPARRTVQMDVSEVAEDPFLEGAKLLVAQASAKRLPLHRLWRWLESMVAVIWLGFLLAYAHWPWWLPLVTLAYALPAVGLHRTRKTLQAPVLALMSQGFAGELAALLRNICLSLAFAICMLLRLGSNPAYREWQSTKLHNVWVKSHLNDHWLFVWAPEISARQIFLAAVIACSCIIGLHCALLCRAVLCACFCATTADGNETVERAQERHARERDEVLALLQERPDVARVNPRIIPVTAFALPWRGGGLYLAVGLVLLDVGLDINTIITFLGGKSFLFAASMTFIVARSFVKQVQVLRPWQLWQAMRASLDRGILRKDLLDFLEEEKRSEALLCACITAYSAFFMVHSAGELLVQLCSLTLSTVMFSSYAVVACDLEDLQMRAVHSEPLEVSPIPDEPVLPAEEQHERRTVDNNLEEAAKDNAAKDNVAPPKQKTKAKKRRARKTGAVAGGRRTEPAPAVLGSSDVTPPEDLSPPRVTPARSCEDVGLRLLRTSMSAAALLPEAQL